jgi:hypothetical protein
MSDADEQQRAGELAEALGALDVHEGAGPTIWSRVINDELARHVEAREQFIAENATLATWERYHGSALVIVVAVDQVLRFENRIRKLTGDAELARARKAFHADVGHAAKAIRDVAMHLDDYAVGQGNRQVGRHRAGESAITDRNVKAFIYWTDAGESYLTLGGDQLSVDGAARAAVALAEVVEVVRGKHQKLAIKRFANAVRRQVGA